MTTRKRYPHTARKKKLSRELARSRGVSDPWAPPRASSGDGESSISIRIPLPPAVVQAVEAHVTSGLRLLAMFQNVQGVEPAELAAAIKDEAEALTRDHRRLVDAYRARKKVR